MPLAKATCSGSKILSLYLYRDTNLKGVRLGLDRKLTKENTTTNESSKSKAVVANSWEVVVNICCHCDTCSSGVMLQRDATPINGHGVIIPSFIIISADIKPPTFVTRKRLKMRPMMALVFKNETMIPLYMKKAKNGGSFQFTPPRLSFGGLRSELLTQVL
jgi:hypothetical protein